MGLKIVQKSKQMMVLFFLLLSFSSLGEIIDFDINLKYGKDSHVRKVNYKIRSKLGENFTLERDGLQIVLKAEKLNYFKSSKKLLHISGKVFETHNGVEKIIARPELITKLNKDATLRVDEIESFFELSLLPTSI